LSFFDRNLSNLKISESFYRLMQTDPTDDKTLIDGTGSLVTYLAVSGTIDAFYIKGDGSQITGISASLPPGVVSSSAQLGLASTDSPTFSGLTVRGTLTAEQYVISSSVLYVTQSFSSGSTLFGNSVDDTHKFTGSVFIQGPLTVTGGITGSLFGSSSWSTYSITSSISNTASYIDPLFISASVAAQGLAGTSDWNQITNKPANLISGSAQRPILGLGETDSPTFANGNYTGNVVVGGTLTARTYIISSSIVNYETLKVSGSSKFGDSLDDTHEFTGSLKITGSLSVNSNEVITSNVTSSMSVLSASYAASASITYVSSSNFSLSEIEVADYDSNVAVTFTGGRLKFIFGTPTVPSSIALSLSGFATNRFNLENDNYDVNGSWNNGGYTIISASLYTGSVLITQVGSGTSLTSNLTTSGSQSYRLQYTASSPLDGSLYSGSATSTGTLSKTNPSSPVQTETATVQLGATSNQIEQGATGSIAISSVTSSANSWTITSFVATGSFASTTIPLFGNSIGSQGTGTVFVTGSATGSNSITITTTANYNSGVLNSPVITTSVTDTITYSKIRSLRHGASPSSSFIDSELENLALWDSTLGGNIGTISKGTTTASGQSVTITWSGDKYHYIVYNSSLSNLTNITTAGFGVLSSFTVNTVGNYKVYRTNTLQAGGAGTSITYVLT
jgi:hypothetical protein